jgi:hypothetical protein
LKENGKKMKAEEKDKDDEKTKKENGMKNCGGRNEADDKTENHKSMKTRIPTFSGSESVRPQTAQYGNPK